MEIERKVFSSSIIRTPNKLKNDLYGILNTGIPALPVVDNRPLQIDTCSFTPKNDKYYVSKKKNGCKVKTVREIRAQFESDTFSYLLGDLEKQKSYLMRKIKHGSSKNENTVETAKKMIESCSPLSKTTWQMLMNINPENHKFPAQYVIYNGKHIQVNGSRGGFSKFLCKRDINKSKETILNKLITRNTSFTRKKGLLRNSLNVKFKPGPLSKKKSLDNSYQKYNFGELELIKLPKPGLHISPSYGKPLAPSINSFLQNTFVLKDNSVISQKWATFAVSMLGKNTNGTAIQCKEDCDITFDLDYKCSQQRILMRKDSDVVNQKLFNDTEVYIREQDESAIFSEVSATIEKIINTVEISLTQNELFCKDDERREEKGAENSVSSSNHIRDKGKRKYAGELGRLDVTVIRISDSSESDSKKCCRYAHCTLGCICDSLQNPYSFKTHCGRFDCMFQCKCDFSKYKVSETLDNDSAEIIRGIVNFEKKLGKTLAKEEHKFHHTVVVTDEKSILLNSRKRNWKTTKRYAEFYSGMQLKTECDITRDLSIVCTDLNIKNVEPWCMVHNLYKCFCKGKFVETCIGSDESIPTCHKLLKNSNKVSENVDTSDDIKIKPGEDLLLEITNNKSIVENNAFIVDESSFDMSRFNCSARIVPYAGRKYNDKYYKNTNLKILEMEQNDKSLSKKLTSLIDKGECKDIMQNIYGSANSFSSSSLDETFSKVEGQISEESKLKSFSSQKLVTWLESNYKKYRAQNGTGLKKPSLYPPRPGNMALYPWEFILDRYREKKNHFLISIQKPYRIFMAVDKKNPMFNNCININDIALSDIDEYPITVKNLLTNATDLTDNFCILCGLSHCWELVGSVTKVNNDKNRKETETTPLCDERSQSDSSELEFASVSSENSPENSPLGNVKKGNDIILEKYIEQSRWFVMIIENDFTELQFSKRGFFVTYGSIINALKVAKVSGKTVKLSAQNRLQRQSNPSFGIYAVPSDNDNDHFVFIGPYDKDEPLDMETVKETYDKRGLTSTRGTWITTNKVDNLKLIDNPLLYMPSTETLTKTITDSSNTLEPNNKELVDKSLNIIMTPKTNNKDSVAKAIKPITIRKTNGFYQLAPNGLLKQVPINNKVNLKGAPLILNRPLLVNKAACSTSSKINLTSIFTKEAVIERQKEKNVVNSSSKPVVEVAPEVKGSATVDNTSGLTKRKKEGMFVLKPEEINKRSFQHQLSNVQPLVHRTHSETEDEIEMDIENFLKTFISSNEPDDDCYVISDDEDDKESSSNTLKNVWIVCKNIQNLGWIPGRKKSGNLLSFEFPGFKYSDFYPEEEAFNKIRQVMSRKTYVPRHIKLEWEALESLSDVKTKNKLQSKDLSSDYVLTKYGFRHKTDLMNKLKSPSSQSPQANTSNCETDTEVDLLNKKNSILKDFEETSETLEEESHFLLDKISKNAKRLASFRSEATEDLRVELTEKLNSIKNKVDSE